MNYSRTFIFSLMALSFLLAACATEEQHDYIQLEIPIELSDNRKIVHLLENNADRINTIINSLDDFTVDAEQFGQLLGDIDTTMNPTEVEQLLVDRGEELIYDYAKVHINMMYQMIRMGFNQKGLEDMKPKLSATQQSALSNMKYNFNQDSVNLRMKSNAPLEKFSVTMKAKRRTGVKS